RERRHLCDELEVPHRFYETEVRGGYVWHLSLTNRGDDRDLSDTQWADAVRFAMVEMGFDPGDPDGAGGGGAGCPWVAVRHGRSRGENDHVHVAVSLVRDDGTTAKVWQDYRRIGAIASQLEE